ncbi:MAG: hypothetical protein D6701_10985 [Gemmatimonadetes bacterium]|nr:MAG: hypothetical protein D6701_10985 [Gemmatimonadota bacterium]
MEHLSTETLARLVDERPTPEEREHLAACRRCADELRALREQTEALGSLPDVRPPQGDWAVLEARLVSEGLVRGSRSVRRFGIAAAPAWMQAAAALVLFLAGSGTGLALAGTDPAVPVGALPVQEGTVTSVSDIRSLDDAARAVRFAEQQYVAALTRYRELENEAGLGTTQDPVARVAALETLLAASQEALRVAPTDPVLNGVFVNVFAERQQMLRQIQASEGDDSWF